MAFKASVAETVTGAIEVGDAAGGVGVVGLATFVVAVACAGTDDGVAGAVADGAAAMALAFISSFAMRNPSPSRSYCMNCEMGPRFPFRHSDRVI